MLVHISIAIKKNQPNTTSAFRPGMLTPILALLLIGLFSPFGCSAPKVSDGSQPSAQPSPVPAPHDANTAGIPAQSAPDACTLLSKAEIEAVQGEPVKEVKSSQGKGPSLLVSQCFFALPTFADSISVALTVSDSTGPSRVGARDLWQEQFHSKAAEKQGDRIEGNGTSSRNKEKREVLEPVAVSGLGDEAYWVRNRFGGALYVLKGDVFFRIGIGGKQDDSLRLKKAQTLAQDALHRMP